jgi:hypothetical protein
MDIVSAAIFTPKRSAPSVMKLRVFSAYYGASHGSPKSRNGAFSTGSKGSDALP